MRRRLTFLLLPLFVSGCLTHQLWTNSQLDSWNEPAPAIGLQLFHDPTNQRVLVVYQEYSGRHEKIRTRAYFVDESLPPAPHDVAPKFVDPGISRSLAPVTVFPAMPANPPDLLFAVAATNGPAFSLYSGNVTNGPYMLPIYDDGSGQVKRIALTPVAATMDLTVIGGAVGVFWLYADGPGLGGSR
jgi:hypothetical protein